MTSDQIITLAREAGLGWAEGLGGMSEFLERFAALVAAAEREECAKVCEEEQVEVITKEDKAYNMAIKHCAAAIRSKK